MGNIVSYDLIIPEEWYINFSANELIDAMQQHLLDCDKEDKLFEGSVITIGGMPAKLRILDYERCWWFCRLTDDELNGKNYFFSGQSLQENLFFSRFQEEYRENQERREVQIQAMDYYIAPAEEEEEDEGFSENTATFERLGDIGDFIKYEVIYPKKWLEGYTEDQLGIIVYNKIREFYDGNIGVDIDDIGDCAIEINGVLAILTIINNEFFWWFRINGDEDPNIENYIFTGNLLRDRFSHLVDINMDITD